KQLEGGAAAETSNSQATALEAGAGSLASGGGDTSGSSAVAPGSMTPGAPSPLEGVERQYESITRWEDLERWLDLLRGADLFSFDTTTTNLDYMTVATVGVSSALERGTAAS